MSFKYYREIWPPAERALMLSCVHHRIRIYYFSLLGSYFIDISKNGFANVGRDMRLRDSVIRFSPANERDIPPSRLHLSLSLFLCGSCIIRLSLLNPRSNLKSEEKLDSLIGRERKSRLGRRESLIKSYRLSSSFTHPPPPPPPSPEISRPQIFAAKEPQTFLLPSLSATPSHSFFFSPSYRRVLNDPRWSCRLISHPLLICFNYRRTGLCR